MSGQVNGQSCAVLSRRGFSFLFGSTAFAFVLSKSTFGATIPAEEQEVSHLCETIHQTVVFKASRKRVYEALTDEKVFDKVVKASEAMQSGMSLGKNPTQISREVGGTFSLFGGHILGRHIELVPEERIVQAWRVATWEAGVYSIARFVLLQEGAGTKLVFDHTGFPNGQGEHLASGWKGNYWAPMAKVLA
jgi:activator of HSP90 ATPase